MSDVPTAVVEAVLAHEHDGPGLTAGARAMTQHRNHDYDGWCIVCRDDVAAILRVAIPHLTPGDVPAWQGDRERIAELDAQMRDRKPDMLVPTIEGRRSSAQYPIAPEERARQVGRLLKAMRVGSIVAHPNGSAWLLRHDGWYHGDTKQPDADLSGAAILRDGWTG